mmetsp:Transcript_25672/g.81523  ORF Transcript_25672/g.81523 Transcript_25672/m.81523 type:complete len:299 (-) Transcript_25672:1548-2444(-)
MRRFSPSPCATRFMMRTPLLSPISSSSHMDRSRLCRTSAAARMRSCRATQHLSCRRTQSSMLSSAALQAAAGGRRLSAAHARQHRARCGMRLDKVLLCGEGIYTPPSVSTASMKDPLSSMARPKKALRFTTMVGTWTPLSMASAVLPRGTPMPVPHCFPSPTWDPRSTPFLIPLGRRSLPTTTRVAPMSCACFLNHSALPTAPFSPLSPRGMMSRTISSRWLSLRWLLKVLRSLVACGMSCTFSTPVTRCSRSSPGVRRGAMTLKALREATSSRASSMTVCRALMPWGRTTAGACREL